MPEGDYKADENITNEDEEYAIITDMSKMMQGNVGYAKTATVNKVLCSWVKKTETGSMPPTIYEPTMHVIVLKCKDGSWAKLQFTVAGNSETNKSGFVKHSITNLSRLNKNETGSLFLTFFLLAAAVPTVFAEEVDERDSNRYRYSILGDVVDENGQPMPGATVRVLGTTFGAGTDSDGEFVIRLENAKEYTLLVSFIGYESQEIKAVGCTSAATAYPIGSFF